MREDQNDLMLAQARSGLTGGLRLANARDAKNARDLDAEMRKRRLARNALLAVRWTEGGGGGVREIGCGEKEKHLPEIKPFLVVTRATI